MAVYHSPRLGLVINAEPEGPRIQFVNGRYQTSDKKEQAVIEGSSGYGLHIFKEEEPVSPPAKKEKPESGKKGKKGKKKSEGDPIDPEFDLDSLIPDTD